MNLKFKVILLVKVKVFHQGEIVRSYNHVTLWHSVSHNNNKTQLELAYISIWLVLFKKTKVLAETSRVENPRFLYAAELEYGYISTAMFWNIELNRI